jgi:glycerol-3-phosphate acyltransferase PlsY
MQIDVVKLVGMLIAAYLAGSIPFSFLIGRWIGGIDLRQHGSGNIGATNVGRVLGWRWGGVALLLDALKGLLPTWGLPLLFFPAGDAHVHAQVASGVFAIAGHMFPCWLGFRGGKGVATALGVIIVIAPIATIWAVGTFALCFALVRIVSLSSILAVLAYAITEMIVLSPSPFASATWSRALFALAVPALIIWRHRSNIARLLKCEEPKFTRKPHASPDTPTPPA